MTVSFRPNERYNTDSFHLSHRCSFMRMSSAFRFTVITVLVHVTTLVARPARDGLSYSADYYRFSSLCSLPRDKFWTSHCFADDLE